MVERKAFLANQSINTVYPNEDNMIIVLITKRIEIVMSIQVCLISQKSFDYKENGGKNLQIHNINIMYPNKENMIVVPITKRMETITSIQVCHISWINNSYEENGGKKSFSCKFGASISCFPMRRT